MILNHKDYERYRKIIKIQNMIRVSRIFLVLIILSLTIVIVYNFDLDFSLHSASNNNQIVNVGVDPECSDLSFQNTSICLNDYVRSIFIYNVTDDEIDLTIEDLKRRGGDCKDWTDFYFRYMEYYGYDQDNQKISGLVEEKGNVSLKHVSLMSFDPTGYCHFDMRSLECYQYVNDKGEVRG